jgi:hypothetical protein
MNSPLSIEQYAVWRQAEYQREAAADRLARQALRARDASPALRARLSLLLIRLARLLASDANPVIHGWELPECKICPDGVEYWPSA